MNVGEKSDPVVVPEKISNNGAKVPAERLEERTGPKGNGQRAAAVWTQSQVAASPGLLTVRQAAQRNKETRFSALLHHVDIPLLHQSYFALKRRSAAGIDGVTWEAYGSELDARLENLNRRIHKGSYRARPARRVYIPKADGSTRPLGIQCLEDKIVQQAVVFVLNAIYEPDFMGFSYGFRPGRGQHDALDAVQAGLYRKKINWVLDADIRKFFDSMSHEWMMRFLEHRIADKRLLRLIRKWLTAGVQEDGQVIRSVKGTPQGAVISPVLANIYLHYVFDLWVDTWRKRRAYGDVVVIRYADDTVLGFQYERDAYTFRQALAGRLAKFGLDLHPDKTRLIQFGRFASAKRRQRGLGKPETFEFLGFTHYCTRSRQNGWFKIARVTSRKRLRAQLRAVKDALRRRINRPIGETGRWLRRVSQGHMNYFAVPGNGERVSGFVFRVSRLWLKMLRRRSQRHRMPWSRFAAIRNFFFPKVRILHPQPLHRFDARTRGRSPVR